MLEGIDRDDVALFSESPCRFLVTVRPNRRSAFEAAMKGFCVALAGEVTREPVLKVIGLRGTAVLVASIWALKRAWQEPLGC